MNVLNTKKAQIGNCDFHQGTSMAFQKLRTILFYGLLQFLTLILTSMAVKIFSSEKGGVTFFDNCNIRNEFTKLSPDVIPFTRQISEYRDASTPHGGLWKEKYSGRTAMSIWSGSSEVVFNFTMTLNGLTVPNSY